MHHYYIITQLMSYTESSSVVNSVAEFDYLSLKSCTSLVLPRMAVIGYTVTNAVVIDVASIPQ